MTLPITKLRQTRIIDSDNDALVFANSFANKLADFVRANIPQNDEHGFQLITNAEIEHLLICMDELVIDTYWKAIEGDKA